MRAAQSFASYREPETAFAFDSRLADCQAAMRFGADDRDAVLNSLSFAVRPADSFILRGGSIEAPGLTASVRKPIFPISSPFYVPDKPKIDEALRAGSTSKTQNLALEFRGDNMDAKAFATGEGSRPSKAWMTLSGSRIGRSGGASLGTFGGIREIGQEREDSWFSSERPILGGRLAEFALEGRLRYRAFGTNFLGITANPDSRPDGRAIRAEAFFSNDKTTIAGGMFRADRVFLDFDGCELETVSRFFGAQSARLDLSRADKSLALELGAIEWIDTKRGEKYWQPNDEIANIGGGARLGDDRGSISFTVLDRERIVTATLAGRKKICVLPLIDFDASIRLDSPEGSVWEDDSIAYLRCKAHVNPFVKKKAGISFAAGYLGEWDADESFPAWKAEIRIEPFFSTESINWRVSFAGAYDAEAADIAALVELKVEYR